MDANLQVPAAPFSFQSNGGVEISRRSANYHPTIWGDYFLKYASELTEIDPREEKERDVLKHQVREMLLAAPDRSLEKLELINTIQRLGVSYHFENEIASSLKHMYDADHECFEADGDDLYRVALRFRQLRQQGHRLSCGVFKKLMDRNGRFNESLVSNIQGMLSLYEVAHLRVRGEEILDEAHMFTTTQLESMIPNMSDPLAAQVFRALQTPIRRTLTRLGGREFLSIYQKDELHNEVLLKFAKLDFNMLQKIHQRELSDLTRWWKALDVAKNFAFARDRLVECYFWILGVYFEPKYSLGRKITTKIIALASIMDDIYDVYGTIDELQLLTDAIERWEISAIDQLPSYMRLYYQALRDVYTEIEEEMAKEGRSHRTHYAITEMKKLNQAYFQEAKWCHESYIPSFEEYMKVALVTASYMMLATASFVVMGEIVTKEALDWVSNEPLIVMAISIVCRLMDDPVTHEFEQEREHVASAVECYMNQYGSSKEDAYIEFNEQVTNAWKDINAECLYLTPVPMPLMTRIINSARVINLLYKHKDWYTYSKTKTSNNISLVLVNPI